MVKKNFNFVFICFFSTSLILSLNSCNKLIDEINDEQPDQIDDDLQTCEIQTDEFKLGDWIFIYNDERMQNNSCSQYSTATDEVFSYTRMFKMKVETMLISSFNPVALKLGHIPQSNTTTTYNLTSHYGLYLEGVPSKSVAYVEFRYYIEGELFTYLSLEGGELVVQTDANGKMDISFSNIEMAKKDELSLIKRACANKIKCAVQ